MNRVSFLVDGFNIYHSVIEAAKDQGGASTKWLDLWSLLDSYLGVIGGGAQTEEVHYFSALALHIDAKKPGTTKRHRDFIECLQSTGVQIHLGKFKHKTVHCNSCHQAVIHHEEKETDVAISVKLLELFHKDACDTAVLVSGDTDLAPAIQTAKNLFPEKAVWVAFPYRRWNKGLADLVGNYFRIKKERYAEHQFTDPFVLPSGREIKKPRTW